MALDASRWVHRFLYGLVNDRTTTSRQQLRVPDLGLGFRVRGLGVEGSGFLLPNAEIGPLGCWQVRG